MTGHTYMTMPLGDQPLNRWLRKQHFDDHAEKTVASISRNTDEPAPQHPNARHQVDHAEGIPLQIIVGGHPIVSMQRHHARPNRIADCPTCGATCTCAA